MQWILNTEKIINKSTYEKTEFEGRKLCGVSVLVFGLLIIVGQEVERNTK